MSPHDLRLRFLTALGLPVATLLATGCKKAPVEHDAGLSPALTATEPAPTFRSGEPARVAAMQAMEATLGPPPAALPSCGKDQFPETLCGFAEATDGPTPARDAGATRDGGAAPRKRAARPFESCGLTGDTLEATSELSWGQTLAATVSSQHPSWRAHDPANASFKLDPLKTRKQRIDVAGIRARVEVEQPAVVVARYAKIDPMRACCYSRCNPLAVAAPTRSTAPPADGRWVNRGVCLEPPPGGTALPAPGAPACPAGVKLGIGPEDDVAPAIVPSNVRTPAGGPMCCYAALAPIPPCSETAGGEPCSGPRPQHARGRPVRENGVLVVAPTVASRDWNGPVDPTLDVDALALGVRERLAEAWTRDAAMEHASVASFARLALELLVLGAPPELVDAAHVAARDEIRHARFAYGVASRARGAPLGPGPLPISAAPATTTLVALARETFVDGCVGETLATLEAWAARDGAEDVEIRAGLERIGAEEASHAELAWRVVGWCIAQGGAPVRAAIAELATPLDAEARAPLPAAPPPEASDAQLARFGVLSEGERLRLRQRALLEIVGPCASALLTAGRRSPSTEHVEPRQPV